MTTILLWLGLTYAAFKFAGMVLASGRSFDRAETTFGERLRAGEPGLFVAAVLVSVPLVMAMSAYSRRTFTSSYRNSITCYGRINALANLPEVRAKVDGFSVYESAQGYKSSAFRMGAHLGMRRDEVSTALAVHTASFSRTYAILRRQESREQANGEVDRTLRCLHPPADPANA
jgi:hypothetical protein